MSTENEEKNEEMNEEAKEEKKKKKLPEVPKTIEVPIQSKYMAGRVTCKECGETKKDRNFYLYYGQKGAEPQKIPYCKRCLKKMISNNQGVISSDKLKKVLKMIDKPFLYSSWKKSVDKGGEVFGIYMKNIGLQQHKYLTWEDSRMEPPGAATLNYDTYFQASQDFELTPAIITKWGGGYKPEEYEAFERKYHLLKHNYLEKTAMHTEALLKYIRYSVKEEIAAASNQVEDAKKWGALAKDAATAAKINPSQLSASDLQDGLSTFGQLVRSVEKAVDIIPILPKFKSQPQDMPDFILLCYINYIRDLKGLPHCEYKDIWKFYDDRKKEYEDRFDFLDPTQDGDLNE